MTSVTPRRKRVDSASEAATVHRVGNPKRVLTAEDEQAIRDAMTRKIRALNELEQAEDAIRIAALDAASHGASVRVLAEFTGKSTSTISGWKRQAR